MELLIFGRRGARMLVFPTRQGRFYDYENWGLVEALRHPVEAGYLQLFCLDSVDSESFYACGKSPWEKIQRHIQYEEYVLNEVIPLTRCMNTDSPLISHGCSIGAYHALNIALRHPWIFKRVVALSGRYDLTEAVGCFPDLFSGYYDQNIYFHTPNHFVPNLNDPSQLRELKNLELTLAVGESDYFAGSNHRLSHALWEKDVWHTFDIWPGKAHRPVYWREMIEKYF